MGACARCYKGWAVYKATLAEPRLSEWSFASSLLSESDLEGFKKTPQSINQSTFVVVVAVVIVIVIITIAPIQCHFRSRRPQAQQPLYHDGHTATGPAHLLTKNLFVPGVIFFSTFWLA